MLYNRRSFLHWYLTEYVEGFLHIASAASSSPLELASRYGDAAREEGNPHTWPVTEAEVRAILEPALSRRRRARSSAPTSTGRSRRCFPASTASFRAGRRSHGRAGSAGASGSTGASR